MLWSNEKMYHLPSSYLSMTQRDLHSGGGKQGQLRVDVFAKQDIWQEKSTEAFQNVCGKDYLEEYQTQLM